MIKKIEAEAKYGFDEETEAGLLEIGFRSGGRGYENMYHTDGHNAYIFVDESGWHFTATAYGGNAEEVSTSCAAAVDAIRKADAYLNEMKEVR